jgi:uncharacterized protein RhaS with RHS repeats
VIGRYIETDPIGLNGGINPYIYTNNMPTEVVDPEGLSSVVYNGIQGQIYVYPGNANTQGPPQQFPAANNAVRPYDNPLSPSSFGPAPSGTFPMGPYMPGNGSAGNLGIGFFPIILPPIPLPQEFRGQLARE